MKQLKQQDQKKFKKKLKNDYTSGFLRDNPKSRISFLNFHSIHLLTFFSCSIQALSEFILSSCYDNLTFSALRTMVTLSRSEAVDLLKSEKGKFDDFNPLTLKI